MKPANGQTRTPGCTRRTSRTAFISLLTSANAATSRIPSGDSNLCTSTTTIQKAGAQEVAARHLRL